MDQEKNMLFCVLLHHPMDAETHNIWRQRREVYQWRSGGWEAEAGTPGVLLRYLEGLYSMSRLCMVLVTIY
jgi:hypothetical protein